MLGALRSARDEGTVLNLAANMVVFIPTFGCYRLAAAEGERPLPYPFSVMDEEDKLAREKLEQAAKAIGDLDDLVQAVRKSLAPAKTWQRQLLTDLSQVDRLTQVLRMTLSMGRAAGEVVAATEQLLLALRVAQLHVSTGRADQVTRAAMMLAGELGSKIGAALA